MKLRLTWTGWLFLGVALVFYFAALTSQSSLLLLLTGVTLGCLAVNAVSAWRAVRSVEIHAPPSVLLCEGERLSQPWCVANGSKRGAGLLQAESTAGVLFRLRLLPAGSRADLVPDLVFGQRGVFTYAQFNLASLTPFGLVKAVRRCRLPGEVVVAPAVYSTEPPYAAGYDLTLGGKLKGHRPATSGAYFAGVRPFQDGDSLRQIHWKSSAKGQGLMVKTFEEELSGRVSFVVDSAQPGQARVFDDCARAAGSLMFAALEAGHHVEATNLHRLELLLVPPFADGREILDWLARLSLVPGNAAARPGTALELFSKRSAVCFVLTQMTPAIVSAIEHLQEHHRHISLYLPKASGLPGRLPQVPVFAYSEKEIVEWA
jgi:uncharacterized protein (DUF58 family)